MIPFACDLSTKEGVDALFEMMEQTFGKADIFIANAGAPYYEKFDYVNWNRVESIFELNTISPIYTYARYLEHLNGREGQLAFTISAMGEMALPGYALYAASKFAMKGFQQAVRLEAPENLKITCIYPVSTETNFFNVGGNGVKMEKPFPVQSPEAVARAAVKKIRYQGFDETHKPEYETIQISCTSSTPFFLQNSEKGSARSLRFSFSPLTGSRPGVTAKPS